MEAVKTYYGTKTCFMLGGLITKLTQTSIGRIKFTNSFKYLSVIIFIM